MDTPWLTKAEGAEYCRVSLATFERWIKDGRVRLYRVEGLQSKRVRRDELDELMVPVEAPALG